MSPINLMYNVIERFIFERSQTTILVVLKSKTWVLKKIKGKSPFLFLLPMERVKEHLNGFHKSS